MRARITPAERLALTIRYLATGNSQVYLSFSFRIGKSTVCGIVKETCEAIIELIYAMFDITSSLMINTSQTST